MVNIKSILALGLLMASTSALAINGVVICPPASAISRNAANYYKWTLAPSYEHDGWSIVNKPYINQYPEDFAVTDKSTLSVRLTHGGAYLPNEDDDNFHLITSSLYFVMTCSYIDTITDGNGKHDVSIDLQTVGKFNWNGNSNFKNNYNEASWRLYKKTNNKAYISAVESMVCMTTAGNSKLCFLPKDPY